MSQDRILLQRIAARDQGALAELYRAYHPRIARFVHGLVRDPDALGEIVNDVFLVVWQKARSFRGDASPSTWILGIAYNKARKWYSRQRQLTTFEDNLPLGTPAESLVVRQELDRVLATLSLEQRAVIELTYYHGYSYQEIADILHCPQNTVKTRMFYARRRLQACAGGRDE